MHPSGRHAAAPQDELARQQSQHMSDFFAGLEQQLLSQFRLDQDAIVGALGDTMSGASSGGSGSAASYCSACLRLGFGLGFGFGFGFRVRSALWCSGTLRSA